MSLRGARRVVGRAVVALLLASTVAALVFHGWLEAQGRTLIVLTRTSNTPVLGWMFGVLTDEPRAEDTVIGGLPALLVRPGEGRSWPAIVFLNGVTRRGRFHPKVQRLAHALARAGYLVAVPDPPGLRDGVLSLRALAGTEAAVRAVLARPDVRAPIALFGVSAGGSLALLAAEDAAIAPHVRVVGGLAPYTNLADVVRIVTTGTYVEGGRIHRYHSKPFAGLVAARSLAAALPSAHDRALILARLAPITVPENAPNLLSPLRELDAARLRPSTRAFVRLLLNRDPQRFDALYRGLPASTRAAVEHLSPLSGAMRLRAPVLIVSAPHDKYFPPEQTRVLARRASASVQLTVTPALAHAVPHFSLRGARGVVEFDLFVVRALHAAG